MASTKSVIAQAIADFNSIEAAIEECGVDVPYDTDTAEYGNKVKEVYEKALSEGKSVYNAETHYDFPSVGNVDMIYKAQSEKLIYQWCPTKLKYEILGASGTMLEVEVINGGDSFG